MKRKVLITETVKTVINCIILPLYFIKFFHEMALFPGFDEEGNEILRRNDYYLSIYGEVCRAGIVFVFWLAFSLSVASIVFSALRIFIKDNRIIKVASLILFGVSVVFFLALIFLFLQMGYKY